MDKYSINITVLGSPKALKRHRTFRRGKFVGTYDPSKNDKADFLQVIQNKAPDKPIEGPVFLVIQFFFDRPKSHYRTGKFAGKLKENAPFWHKSRPDLDNLIKFITDAMNGVFYRDDAQIAKITALKIYGERPLTEILIEAK